MRTLEARVRLHQPRVAVIELRGEINTFAEETLNAAYQEAERAQPEAILLNFAAVDYINSSGIALIVAVLARARQSNQRLMACGLSQHYAEIFAITRLTDFLATYPDEATALSAHHDGPRECEGGRESETSLTRNGAHA